MFQHQNPFIFVTILIVLPLFASVHIEIADTVLVETAGNVTVQIDGDLSETTGGYLSGEISSGSRVGLTSFAGLTLSSGLTGSVTRNTGSAYSKGNGEGINLKRYYEINNTSGSALNANLQTDYISTGNDEQNGLSGPYFVYKYASAWTGYGDGTTASPITASSVSIPTGSSDWVFSEGIRLSVKLFLEGPYDTTGDTMTTTLGPDADDVIPLTSPYTEDPRSIGSVPSNIMDWVLAEVRSTANGSPLGYRSCFLHKNGNLVGDDGATVYIGLKVQPGNYFIAIRHRNHLAALTKAAESGLTWGVTPTQYNFTTGSAQFYGTNSGKELETNVWGAWAGDVNQDREITSADYVIWYNSIKSGESGYKVSDCNGDGQVTVIDYSVWYNNAIVGAASGVP